MKIWGAGLIGCGAISRVHLATIDAMENVKLVAVCDVDAQKAQAVAEQYGCKAYTDYHDLLADPQVETVHITTPHYLHVPMAMDALKAGKKVLSEKPISHDLAQAAQLLDLAKDKDLAICFQNRYNDSTQKAMELIRSGKYGKVVTMRGMVCWHRDADPYYSQSPWRGSWDTEGGGVLINQSIHTLDLLLWIGGEVASVKGAVSTDTLYRDIEVEDSAHFVIHFKNGLLATFYATNSYGVNAPITVEVVLEKATLELRGDSLYLIENDEMTQLVALPGKRLAPAGKGYWGVGHGALIADLYRSFEAGEHFWIDAQVGYNALETLKGVYQSSKENQEIYFK
jgi:UDP-N-acetyl-2-amino-2-deoxyglucuronate dehydrogenase